MFSQISVSLFGFWVGLAIIHGAGAGAQMQTEALAQDHPDNKKWGQESKPESLPFPRRHVPL